MKNVSFSYACVVSCVKFVMIKLLYTLRSFYSSKKLSDKFKIMISIMTLLKYIKLLGQSDSYYLVQVEVYKLKYVGFIDNHVMVLMTET